MCHMVLTTCLTKHIPVIFGSGTVSMKESTQTKYLELQKYLANLKNAAIAFSSGVDSTLLLRVAHDVLGDNILAITARSCAFSKREFNEAQAYCERNHIRHVVVETDELSIDGFRQNPPERCYLCKRELFKAFWMIARSNRFDHLCEGSNLDDDADYRPGRRALRELAVQSPLRACSLSKAEIREISQALGLSTAKKPSFACLASRFAYGEEITQEKLAMVERAEQLLIDLGFDQVRVRIHETLARIEVSPDQLPLIMKPEVRGTICTQFKAIGFSYITLDLMGYRLGSMNETLPDELINKFSH